MVNSRSALVSLVLALGCQSTNPCPPLQPVAAPAPEPSERDAGALPIRYTYDDAGALARIERDSDGDGRFDQLERFEAGRLAGIELDSDGDGRANAWIDYDLRTGVRSARRDTDGDGLPDEDVDPARLEATRLTALIGASPIDAETCRDASCRSYLLDVSNRLLPWLVAHDPGYAIVSFQVAPDGCPYDVSVLGSSAREAASASLRALEFARPLPPPEPEVADKPLRTRLTVSGER